MIVNYLRKALGQQSGGHISPLAAYDVEADRFLILEVARYKYPPVWVKASDLFDAMNTTDGQRKQDARLCPHRQDRRHHNRRTDANAGAMTFWPAAVRLMRQPAQRPEFLALS